MDECICDNPKTVPTKCEVQILIDMMNVAISDTHRLAAQWLRAAFHDAGTFNQNTQEGGANGCLLNEPDMLNADESKYHFHFLSKLT